MSLKTDQISVQFIVEADHVDSGQQVFIGGNISAWWPPDYDQNAIPLLKRMVDKIFSTLL